MLGSPITKRRWRNFRSNNRAFWSLIIFSVLFTLSLFAEFIANDKPIFVSYRGEIHMPIFTFYPETRFGGDFKTEAAFKEVEVECLILSGGLIECFEEPEDIVEAIKLGEFEHLEIHRGWIVWPLIPYSFDTSVDVPGAAPLPPSKSNILGTDDVKRDVLARVIYGFRISIMFTLLVTIASSLLGILAGAVQGYFGGRTDLLFQRFIEIWGAVPSLYVIIILFAILGRSFWLLVLLTVLFGWMGLVGVVRAEFLRARNFEYVLAAKALGISNSKIMFKHLLPNAMVAALTFLPFILNGSIVTLTSLDFLGFGLPPGSASLGELLAQGKNNIHAPWLGLTSFFGIAILLSLLIFIGEGVRDAFDPRKVFIE